MESPRAEERRRHKRRELCLPVQLRRQSGTEYLSYETHDISPGGIFVPTMAPLPVGMAVHARLQLDALNVTVEATGRVLRTQAEATKSGQPAGMAVEFSEQGKAGWDVLGQILEAQEDENST